MPDDLMLKNVFDWDHFYLYLSGPIDFDRSGGRSWRDQWTEELVEIGLKKHQILNPCKKPLIGCRFNLDNEAEIMNKHRKNREWKELCDVMSEIVHVDLRLVDKSDVILVNLPKVNYDHYKELDSLLEKHISDLNTLHVENVFQDRLDLELEAQKIRKEAFEAIYKTRIPTYGTIHEIVVARQQRKPVYLVWEGGKDTCSAWLMWLVGHRNVFSTFDEVKTRLDNIAKGKTAYNARDWLLLDLDDV